MLNNINNTNIYQFNDNAVLIVEQSEKMFLVGPQLNNIEQLTPAEAYIFHLVRELKEFNAQEILTQFTKLQNKCRPQDSIFIIKSLNKFLNKGLLSLQGNALTKQQKTIPRFEIDYEFEDSNGVKQHLTAQTLANKVAYHWALALNFQLTNHPSLFHNGLFYGSCFGSIDECFEKIDQLIRPINETLIKVLGDEEIKSIWPTPQKSREYLWKLHQVFEDYYPKFLDPEFYNKNEEITKLGNNFKLLNYTIHMAEDALENWVGGFVEVIFDYHTKPMLLDADKEVDLLFTPNFEENTIYLNYFQVGYSYLAAHDAGTDSQPVPQRDFCANHFIYMRPDNKFTENKRKKVADWLDKTHARDINDPSLRLGHIPLAKIKGSLNYSKIIKKLTNSTDLKSITIKSIS